jgi:hypothetical protein
MTVVGCNNPITNTETQTTNIESENDSETLTGVLAPEMFIDSTNELEPPAIDSITGSIDPEIADSIR